MSFPSFVRKYGIEALSVAKALNSIIGGIALPADERAKVSEAIEALETAATNIAGSRVNSIKIAQKDIDAAVARVLPDLVDAAVAKALAKASGDEK